MNKKQEDKIVRDWQRHMELTRHITIDNIGEDNYERYYEKSREELQKLLPIFPEFEKSVNRMFFFSEVPFAISQYRNLLHEFNYSKEDAYKILSAIVTEQVIQRIERSPITKFMYGIMHKFPKFIINLMTKQFDVKEKNGWLFEFPKKDFFMGQNCVQCGALIWLKEQDAPEICKIICYTDYLTASYMKGLRFIRTKTLAYGNEMCDFQYYKNDKIIDMDNIKLK